MTFWFPWPLCDEGNSAADARNGDIENIASRITPLGEKPRYLFSDRDLAFVFKLPNYQITQLPNSSRLLRLSTHILFSFLSIPGPLQAAGSSRIAGIQLHCCLKIADGLSVITFIKCCV